jgi:hypothetical protein
MTTSHVLQDCPLREALRHCQEVHLAKWCQPTGPTVRRQSRYAEDSGVHPTSGIDCLEKSEREEEDVDEEEEFLQMICDNQGLQMNMFVGNILTLPSTWWLQAFWLPCYQALHVLQKVEQCPSWITILYLPLLSGLWFLMVK